MKLKKLTILIVFKGINLTYTWLWKDYTAKTPNLLMPRSGPNVIKLFVRHLQVFGISKCFCLWQAFPAWYNKHYSLVQK